MHDSSRNTVAVALGSAADEMASAARALAKRLGLPLASQPCASSLLLTYSLHGLELQDLSAPQTRPLRVDFSGVEVRRGSPNLSGRQPLARAMGKKNKTLMDATAGLAQDAFLLAALGYEVSAFERNGVLVALVQDALARLAPDSAQAKVAERLSLSWGDGRELIPKAREADVVYLDPMFPAKPNKAALARKEMRLVRALVGDTPDAGALFEVARTHATNRVVVKRPHYAEPLAPGPDFAIKAKLVRYDVYLTLG